MDAKADSAGVQSRQLGPQEQYLHELHGYGGLIPVNVQHIRGPLTADLVRRGLDWLQRKHPLLRAHIRYKGWIVRKEAPFFVPRAYFDLDGTTEIPLTVLPAGTDWQALLHKELKRPLARGRNPRMAAFFVPPDAEGISHLITKTDHTIADAPAGMMVSRQLFEFFADPEREQPPLIGLPPALETLLPPKPRSGTMPYIPAIRLPHKVKWSVAPDTHGVKRKFTAGETAAINEAARKNRATVHGVVSAALLEAIREQYGLHQMTSLSTIELRRMCRPPLPATTFGCYIDILRTKHDLDQPFWDLARDAAYKLITTVAKEQADASILKPFGWDIVRAEIRGGMMKYGFRLDGMGITSAGRIDLPRQYGPFEIVDNSMLMSMHLIGPGFFAVNFETEGCLQLSLMFSARVSRDEEMDDLVGRAAERLRNLPAA